MRKLVAGLVVVVLFLLVVVRWQQRKIDDLKSRFACGPTVPSDGPPGVVRHNTSVLEPGQAASVAEDAGIDVAALEQDGADAGAVVTGVSTVTVRGAGHSSGRLPSSSTAARPAPTALPPSDGGMPEAEPLADPWGHQRAQQLLKLEEPIGGLSVPWGQVGFSAWEERPWALMVLPRTYRLTTVSTTNDDGSRTLYSRFVVDVAGKSFEVPIAAADHQEEPPPAKFRWRVGVSLGVDLAGTPDPARALVLPGLQVSGANYGRSDRPAAWTFLAAGIAYDPALRGVWLTLSPALWNLSPILPWVENLYAGPTVGLSFDGGWAAGGGVKVRL